MLASMISTTRLSVTRRSCLQARTIYLSPVAYKSVTEKVSEVADKVNRKVGKGLASAIETGEHATQATKEKLGSTAEQVKDNADHASKAASQKTDQAAAAAREAKKDIEKEVTK